MSAPHTPGPWVSITGKSGGTQDCFYIHSVSNPLAPRITTVFPVNGVLSTARANARLIAAAPELLAALKDACEIITGLSQFANNNGGMIDNETFAEGLAAIAKATGEQA